MNHLLLIPLAAFLFTSTSFRLLHEVFHVYSRKNPPKGRTILTSSYERLLLGDEVYLIEFPYCQMRTLNASSKKYVFILCTIRLGTGLDFAHRQHLSFPFPFLFPFHLPLRPRDQTLNLQSPLCPERPLLNSRCLIALPASRLYRFVFEFLIFTQHQHTNPPRY